VWLELAGSTRSEAGTSVVLAGMAGMLLVVVWGKLLVEERGKGRQLVVPDMRVARGRRLVARCMMAADHSSADR
jgi:hypothetical protein